MSKVIRNIREHRFFSVLFLLLSITTCFFIWFSFFDLDFYHLADSGRWMVRHKAFQYDNNEFALDGYNTVIQQWLYCLLLYGSSLFGRIGVYLFTLLQCFVLIFLFYKFLRIFNIDFRVSIVFSFLAVLINCYMNCRPEIISLILLMLQFIVVEKYKISGNKKLLYLLPLIVLFEINLHGTYWLFHYVFLLPYFVPFNNIINKIFRRTVSNIRDNNIDFKPFILPLILMTVCLFINPYGYKLVFCLFASDPISKLGISELKSFFGFLSGLLSSFSLSSFLVFLFVCSIFLFFIYTCRKFFVGSDTFYFLIGIFIMFFLSFKNIMFISIVLLFVVKDFFVNFSDFDFILMKLHKHHFAKKSDPFVFMSLIGAVLAIVFVHMPYLNYKSFMSRIESCQNMVDVLLCDERKNDLSWPDVKVYSSFGNGAFLLWHDVGRVYLTNKTEPYLKFINNKEDVVSEYVDLCHGVYSDIGSFLSKYDFDYLCLNMERPLDRSLQIYMEPKSDYKQIYFDKKNNVYIYKKN